MAEYAIESGWLVEVVNEHTCGTGDNGYYGMHEPGCGTIPLMPIEELLKEKSKMTTEETIEALATFESWREDTLLAGPDVSLTAYIKVLEAGQPDPRIAQVHEILRDTLDEFSNMTEVALRKNLLVVLKLTDPTATPEVESINPFDPITTFNL